MMAKQNSRVEGNEMIRKRCISNCFLMLLILKQLFFSAEVQLLTEACINYFLIFVNSDNTDLKMGVAFS